MVKDLVVTRSIFLNATPERVWEALTHPGMTKHYMFDCAVCSDWNQGSAIEWRGNYSGQDVYQTGEILEIIPFCLLKFSSYDGYGGDRDKAESYFHISFELIPRKGVTQLLTSIDNFGGDEIRAEQIATIWDLEVLPRLKGLVETTL